MSWVSTMGRRFLEAYTEGLVMTCPLHRAGDIHPGAGINPGAMDQPQDDVRAALRPEYAGSFPSAARH